MKKNQENLPLENRTPRLSPFMHACNIIDVQNHPYNLSYLYVVGLLFYIFITVYSTDKLLLLKVLPRQKWRTCFVPGKLPMCILYKIK